MGKKILVPKFFGGHSGGVHMVIFYRPFFWGHFLYSTMCTTTTTTTTTTTRENQQLIPTFAPDKPVIVTTTSKSSVQINLTEHLLAVLILIFCYMSAAIKH